MTARPLCPPDHKHGQTPTCYRGHKCGCDECRQANTDRCYARKKLIAYGRPTSTLTSPAPARERIRELLRNGWGTKAIAQAAGVHPTTVQLLVGRKGSQRAQTIRSETAEKILAVTIDTAAPVPTALVNAQGAVRRIRALGTLGWSQVEIGRRTGIHPVTIHEIPHRKRISAAHHQRIAAVYELLWNVSAATDPTVDPRAAAFTVAHARRAGYLPPMAWDDIDTDPWPPTAHHSPYLVDEIAVEQAIRGERVDLHPQEIAEVVRRGTRANLSAAEIAERVDRTQRTVTRMRSQKRTRAA